MRLQNKTALVTGASRGIGRAIALKLASQGARVAVHYNGSKDAAEEVLSEIGKANGSGFLVQGDISNVQQAVGLWAQIEKEFSTLDILVNNAGCAQFKPLEEVEENGFDAIFNLNVKGLFFLTQALAPHLNDGGRIVNISSGITRANVAGGSVYTGSKAAVEGFSKSWAAEFGPRGITVNVVSPGMTKTDLLLNSTPPEVLESFAESTLLGRLGETQDIADVVAFVCSDEARWLTANNILANGGAV